MSYAKCSFLLDSIRVNRRCTIWLDSVENPRVGGSIPPLGNRNHVIQGCGFVPSNSLGSDLDPGLPVRRAPACELLPMSSYGGIGALIVHVGSRSTCCRSIEPPQVCYKHKCGDVRHGERTTL